MLNCRAGQEQGDENAKNHEARAANDLAEPGLAQ
jgi:hypothetical protein